MLLWTITWAALVIFLYSIHAYFSYQNKDAEGVKPFILVWLISICISPVWAIVSRYSKNLLFDGLLYDVLIFITYATVFIILETHYLNFKPANYVGIGLVLIGMFLIKA